MTGVPADPAVLTSVAPLASSVNWELVAIVGAAALVVVAVAWLNSTKGGGSE